MIIKLPPQALQNILWEETLPEDEHYGELISSDEEVGKSRWANVYEMIFKYKDKFYSTTYRLGTGDDGERPFEHDKDDINCYEVEPYEVTITKYRKV